MTQKKQALRFLASNSSVFLSFKWVRRYFFKSAISLAVFAIAFWGNISVYAASPAFDDGQASTLTSKVNGYRTGQGKSALKYSSKLASVAKARLSAVYSSQTLINSGDPSHTIPGFGSFDAQAKTLGLVSTENSGIGENFFISSSGVDGVYNNWLKSPSHLDNITDSSYAYTAIALSTNIEEIGDPRIPANLEPGGVVAIQVFASANVIDGTTSPAPSNPTTPPTNNTTPTQPNTNNTKTTTKPATTKPETKATTKTTTPAKPKIDKAQKVGFKLKFDDLSVSVTKLFQ